MHTKWKQNNSIPPGNITVNISAHFLFSLMYKSSWQGVRNQENTKTPQHHHFPYKAKTKLVIVVDMTILNSESSVTWHFYQLFQLFTAVNFYINLAYKRSYKYDRLCHSWQVIVFYKFPLPLPSLLSLTQARAFPRVTIISCSTNEVYPSWHCYSQWFSHKNINKNKNKTKQKNKKYH